MKHVSDIDSSGLFSLNKDSGEISVATAIDADRSVSNSYTYIVEVSVSYLKIVITYLPNASNKISIRVHMNIKIV